MASALPHLLQSFGFAAVQELRSAGREINVRHRGDGRFRPRVDGYLELTYEITIQRRYHHVRSPLPPLTNEIKIYGAFIQPVTTFALS